MNKKIALSIGGSDSGGGAGIQADLRTFFSLKVHGCTAITCTTAQNSQKVSSVQAIQENHLNDQIDSVLTDFDIKALKTGMLLNENIIKTVALRIQDVLIPKIIDPVMVSKTGSKLLEESAINAYKKLLIPQAELITPNIFEAKLLSNFEIRKKEDIEQAGSIILGLGTYSVLIKGGGLDIFKGQDFYIDQDDNRYWLSHKYIKTKNTHGSGCSLSAAICGFRALGFDLLESIKKAKVFLEKSLQNSYKIGSGPGPLGHYYL
tara:strand:- start:1846 stop:2631 length:786 start_codon:yes stop_codon:yes gene_type:complete